MTVTSPLQKNNVTIAGNPAARATLVFGHGFGTDQSAWQTVAEPFASDYRIICYDNIGARSTNLAEYDPLRYDTLEAYVLDLLAICRELDLNNATFVGHSLSGLVGILAVNRSRQHFSRLLLVGASPRYLNDAGYYGGFEKSDLDQMYLSMQTNYLAWASGFAPLVMGNEDRPELARDYAKSLQQVRPDIALGILRMAMQSDIRDQLPLIDIPTLIVQSHQDIAVPLEVGDYLHTHIRHSRLEVIEAAGHLPHLSAPDQVIAVLKTFLNA